MRRNKKIMLTLLLLLGIGFATITTALYLNGSISVRKNESDFNVKFVQAKIGETDVSDTVIKDEGTSITFATGDLYQVNETADMKIKIKNESSLYDADVTMECTDINHQDYIDFSVTIGGETRKVIKAQHTTNGLISVKIKRTSLEDFDESFTCTLNATAIERTTALGEDPETFVKAYAYNQVLGADNYCVRGNEPTCQETTCYKTKEAGSCPAGTIIKYMVNEDTEKTFHVMYDDASTITMQTQKDLPSDSTVYWVTKSDYAKYGANSNYGEYGNTNRGPLTVLDAIDTATSDWENVNIQTYKLGETIFKTNQYTLCPSFDSCTENRYILPAITSRARIISVQELASYGCTTTDGSCPIWIYNYLRYSSSYGGTGNEYNNTAYWTMSANATSLAWIVSERGTIDTDAIVKTTTAPGYRAVVQVDKE